MLPDANTCTPRHTLCIQFCAERAANEVISNVSGDMVERSAKRSSTRPIPNVAISYSLVVLVHVSSSQRDMDNTMKLQYI